MSWSFVFSKLGELVSSKRTTKKTQDGQDEAQDGQDEAQDGQDEAQDGQVEAQDVQDAQHHASPSSASSAHPERSIRISHRLRTKLGPSWVQGGFFEQLLLPSKIDVLRGSGAKK